MTGSTKKKGKKESPEKKLVPRLNFTLVKTKVKRLKKNLKRSQRPQRKFMIG